jgi:glycosyltransferase involved in cell wall biosynthesis
VKIALTTNNYPPEFRGGTECVVEALAHGLRAAGDDVLVISGSEQPHDGRDIVREDDAGIPVLRLPLVAGEDYGLNVPRPRILELIRGVVVDEGVDVLHVHHWSHLSDGQVRMVRDLDRGCVVTLHDVWTTCPRFFRVPPDGIECPTGSEREACIACANLEFQESESWVRERLERRDRDLAAELRFAHAVFTPSAACQSAFATYLAGDYTDRILVQPHGLLDGGQPPERGPLGLPLRVGTFGNLNREKGVLDLVEAMEGVRAELHLFGGARDDFEREAKALAQRLDVKLTWHGDYRSVEGHPALQLDLAVFPSRCDESYGLVVDEALHHGTPVVVSDRGALPERVARGGGVQVPAGDREALATAIRGLVEDRDAYHMLRLAIPTEFPTVSDAVNNYRHAYSKAWAAARVIP